MKKHASSQTPFVRLRDTTIHLYLTELKNRYAGSLLGPTWILLYPALFTGIVSTVFSQVFRQTTLTIPYFLYVLSGFVIWNYFAQSVTQSMHAIFSQRQLVKNTTIPPMAIPLSQVFSRLTDAVLLTLIVIALSAMNGVLHFSVGLLFIPIVLMCQTMLQLGIGLVAALISSHFRDTRYVIELLLQLGFYATPIVYGVNDVPKTIGFIIARNPLALLVSSYREMVFGPTVNVTQLVLLMGMATCSFGIGYLLFTRYRHTLPEVL